MKDELLEKVDTRQIPFVAGVELSFLSPGQQEIVMGAIEKTSCGRIDRQKALKLKDAANKNVLDEKTAEDSGGERQYHWTPRSWRGISEKASVMERL